MGFLLPQPYHSFKSSLMLLAHPKREMPLLPKAGYHRHLNWGLNLDYLLVDFSACTAALVFPCLVPFFTWLHGLKGSPLSTLIDLLQEGHRCFPQTHSHTTFYLRLPSNWMEIALKGKEEIPTSTLTSSLLFLPFQSMAAVARDFSPSSWSFSAFLVSSSQTIESLFAPKLTHSNVVLTVRDSRADCAFVEKHCFSCSDLRFLRPKDALDTNSLYDFCLWSHFLVVLLITNFQLD